MLDIGWSELLVIGALALIVVGPKDLPKLLRNLGRYAAQARGMAREFQRSMEDAAREADLSDMKELKDVARDLREVGRMPHQKVGAAKTSPTKPPSAGVSRPEAPAAAKPETAPAAESASRPEPAAVSEPDPPTTARPDAPAGVAPAKSA